MKFRSPLRILAASMLVVATMLFFDHALADENGLGLLKRMSVAADTLDYSGEFVYVKDGQIASMKISHLGATENASSQQKLMALDGSKREIIQQDDIVACVLPDQKMGLREKRQSKQLFKFSVSDRLESISDHYEIDKRGPKRVANRACEWLQVAPKDAYRYGYDLCIDDENQLLLSSEMRSSDGELLESYQFVNITFGAVDSADIASVTPPASLNWMDDKAVQGEQPDDRQEWQVTKNQTGFELEHYIRRYAPVVQSDITHLVLGDGLAQVSVFIIPADASQGDSGTSLSMGGLNSHTVKQGDFNITAIGEAPMRTVKLIAEHTGPITSG